MITISLCMIVKNEEDVIERCLKSVSDLVDEIIIIDTGSSDNTKALLSQFTDRVFDFQWIDDFAAARNASFEKATMDYILWLDADDVLEEADRKKLKELKESLDPEVDYVSMAYHLAFDEYGNLSFSFRRNRLVKRARGFRWIGAVHEYLEVWGKPFHSDIAVTHKSIRHDSDRNLKIYERRLEKGETFSPRDMYYFANELLDHKQYERAAAFYEDFLATDKGWIEDAISSCGKLSDCYHSSGDKGRALEALLRSLRYDSPRPEFCYRMGNHFLECNNIPPAVFWYKLAIQMEPPQHSGFQNASFHTWLPHLQLCICYYRMGKYKLSYLHNEAALQYRPGDDRILRNKKLLEPLVDQDEQVNETV